MEILKSRSAITVCRVLELSPSTYFARKKRPKSARRLRDETLAKKILLDDAGGAVPVHKPRGRREACRTPGAVSVEQLQRARAELRGE